MGITTIMANLINVIPLSVVLCVFILSFGNNQSAKAYVLMTDHKVLDQFLTNLTKKAYPALRPNATGDPVKVICKITMEHLGPTNEEEMSFGLDIYLRYRWVDPRLTFPFMNPDEFFPVPSASLDKFWRPDIVFPNIKKGDMLKITIPNQFLRIFPNGTVIYSTRLSMTVDCGMDLSAYPFDKQVCSFRISSYNYMTSGMILAWETEGMNLQYWKDQHQISTDQVEMYSHKLRNCDLQFSDVEYPCIEVLFYLERHPGYAILHTYVPTFLVVCMSWVPFWIHPNFMNARASLGGSTIITMSTVFIAKAANIRVSYAFAVDYWVTFCLIFVFSAFFESVIVSYLYQFRKKRLEKLRMNRTQKQMEEPRVEVEYNVEENRATVVKNEECPSSSAKKLKMSPSEQEQANKLWYMTSKWSPNGIDKLARIGFPIGFVIYNVIYWSVVMGTTKRLV